MHNSSPLPAHVYAVILAGGSGTRFWPKSRHKQPKQLCKIGDSDLTMIELTLKRLDGLIPKERRIIVTHHEQVEQTKALTAHECGHFIAEPAAKNTANALALAAFEIRAISGGDPKAVMISLHADALIQKLDVFQSTLRNMVQAAESSHLTLLGITPEYAEIGYGYIEKGENLPSPINTYRVSSFREKPHRELAEQYVISKRFLWNSGIFAWKIEVLIEELTAFVPRSVDILQSVFKPEGLGAVAKADLALAYGKLESTAIDPAVLEKSKKVVVIEADIGWKDVGSWDALAQCFTPDKNGNLFYGDVLAIDTKNVTVDSDVQVVACVGLTDLVVVVSQGAVLVCPKDRAQDVKLIVEELKKQGRTALL